MHERAAIMMRRDWSESDGGPEADIFAACPRSQSVWDDRPAYPGDIENCP